MADYLKHLIWRAPAPQATRALRGRSFTGLVIGNLMVGWWSMPDRQRWREEKRAESEATRG